MFRREHVNDEGRRNSSDFNEKHFPQYQFHVSRIASIPILAIYDYYLFCQQNPILLLLLSSLYTLTHTWNTHITNSTSVSSKFNSSSRMNFSFLWGIRERELKENKNWNVFFFVCVTGTHFSLLYFNSIFILLSLNISSVLRLRWCQWSHGIFIFKAPC